MESRTAKTVFRLVHGHVKALMGVKQLSAAEGIDAKICHAVGTAMTSDDSAADLRWNIVSEHWLPALANIHRLVEANASAPAPTASGSPSRNRKPQAPTDLISLMDLAVTQIAIEIVVCWGMYPCLEPGIAPPIQMRSISKAFKGRRSLCLHELDHHAIIVDLF